MFVYTHADQEMKANDGVHDLDVVVSCPLATYYKIYVAWFVEKAAKPIDYACLRIFLFHARTTLNQIKSHLI